MSEEPERVAKFIELRSPEDLVAQVCARTAMHVERGETVAIYATDENTAAQVDSALWTFRQNAFIPHVRLEEATEELIEPVVIFGGDPGDVESDVLILACTNGPPDWLDRFAHVYDFAPLYDEQLREAARCRYTTCREAGYRMRFIKP
ncbi:MAG: DNA polymerase III subunit chi [Planctomycetota bacterium]|jgi:DNA polymerase-3 subunit chi